MELTGQGNTRPDVPPVCCFHVYPQAPHVLPAGDHHARSKRLQDKMVANLAMAKDRLALLGECSDTPRFKLRWLMITNSIYVSGYDAEGQHHPPCFTEATLESKRRSSPPKSSNHVLPQPKLVPKCQPAVKGVSTNSRPCAGVRPPSRPGDPKVTLLNPFSCPAVFHVNMCDSEEGNVMPFPFSARSPRGWPKLRRSNLSRGT